MVIKLVNKINEGNIMFLSPIGYEDLELENINIPNYELLRDAMLEKILMLTISYFLYYYWASFPLWKWKKSEERIQRVII